MRSITKFKNLEFLNQDESVVSAGDKLLLKRIYSPIFAAIWMDIESVTGYRWMCTSLMRRSPSHIKAQAFDIAPDFEPAALAQYSVTWQSDPVLYKRRPLMDALRSLEGKIYSQHFKVGIFVESDHLHIQLLAPSSANDTGTKVVSWEAPKPIYPDTYTRQTLPMTSRGYR